MKILYVTTISNAINDFLIPHIKQLVDMGNQVDIACNIVREPSPVLLELGVRIHKLPFRRTPFHWDNLKAAKEIKRLVLSEGYYIVHTHTPVASFFTRAACRNIPHLTILYTAHGFHFYKGAPLVNRVLFYHMEKTAARWTDGLITLNQEDYLSAGKLKLRKSDAVYYVPGVGIDFKQFVKQTTKEKGRVREIFGFHESEFILFFAAELNRNKHQDLLIDVVMLLKDKGIDVTLLLAGEGESAHKYKQLVKEKKLEGDIVFLGFRNDVPTLLQMVDVVVSSSRREGLPVNVMEAMATGLPLVVTNCRGNRDLVVNEENGYIVEADDAVRYAEAVEQLYQSEKLRRRFGKRSLEYIREYSLESVLLKMKDIYEKSQSGLTGKTDPTGDITILEYDSLEECEFEIRELYGKIPVNPFFTYEWLSLWKKYFAPKDKEKILVVQEHGKTIGFLPLVYRRNRFLFTKVYQIAGTHKSNYLCMPAVESRKKEIYNKVFQHLKYNWRGAILLIEGINDSCLDYSILCEEQERQRYSKGHRLLQFPCPNVSMTGSWDDFFNRHYTKSKRRSKMRSFETKLERTGEVKFIRINNKETYDTYENLLDQTYVIHHLRFRNQWNSSRYSDEAFSGFFRELLREYAGLGLLDMSLLCIDGRVVSFLLALKQDKTLIHYVPGYYIPFQCFSLGHIHLMKLFRCILDEKEIVTFDFSLGNQEYKERWADGLTYNYSFLFCIGCNPFARVGSFLIKQLMTLKIIGRKKGWNEKIKGLLVRIRNRKTRERIGDEEGTVESCSVESIYWSTEKEYDYKDLLSMPLPIQTFVLKQIYWGKQVAFLYQGAALVGIKSTGNQEENIYQYKNEGKHG